MQSTELRIGNLVCLKGVKIVHKVSASSLYQGIAMDCDPIPLTEEILLRCGFAVHNVKMPLVNWDDYRIGNMVLNKTDRGFEVEFGSIDFSIEERTHIASVQYLHHLQNLYYVITGKELTVNL